MEDKTNVINTISVLTTTIDVLNKAGFRSEVKDIVDVIVELIKKIK